MQINVKNNTKPINVASGQLVTSKKDSKNHGIGTKNMQHIAEKYHGSMKWYYKENIFELHLVLDLGINL